MTDQDQPALVVEGELRDGFTAIPNRILRDPAISTTGKMLYATLLSFAWDKDKVWPSYETLMTAMSVGSKTTISRAISELETAGLLSTTRRMGKTQVYTLRLVVQKVDRSRTHSGLPVVQNVDQKNTKEKNTKTEVSLEREAIRTAFVELCYAGKAYNQAALTTAVSAVLEMGGKADHVRKRYARMRAAWSKNIPVTPHAIVKHWDSFSEEAAKGNGSKRDANDYAAEDYF